jgi:hypothetical protein
VGGFWGGVEMELELKRVEFEVLFRNFKSAQINIFMFFG